jgi:hypothetical protein
MQQMFRFFQHNFPITKKCNNNRNYNLSISFFREHDTKLLAVRFSTFGDRKGTGLTFKSCSIVDVSNCFNYFSESQKPLTQ